MHNSGLISTLQMFLKRPKFLQMCQKWRARTTPVIALNKVYDGRLWKEWDNFLNEEANFLLMLNVDWFRPFKHTQYSAGVYTWSSRNFHVQ